MNTTRIGNELFSSLHNNEKNIEKLYTIIPFWLQIETNKWSWKENQLLVLTFLFQIRIRIHKQKVLSLAEQEGDRQRDRDRERQYEISFDSVIWDKTYISLKYILSIEFPFLCWIMCLLCRARQTSLIVHSKLSLLNHSNLKYKYVTMNTIFAVLLLRAS